MTKKITRYILIIGAVAFILILFLLYLVVFVVIRPFDGEITQDRPLMKMLCDMQYKCGSGVGLYQCQSMNQGEYLDEKFSKWKGYKGCNESTPGFYEREDGYKGIYVEGCGCRGLM